VRNIPRPRPAARPLLVSGFLCLAAGGLPAVPAAAQIPAGYYDTVDTTSAATLRATLHALIRGHQRFPYTSTATDTWDILEPACEDPNNTANILDVYRNDSHPKQGAGNPFYDREHTWPNSYGFPDDNSTNYPYTDCHMLFLCDGGYNSSRGNRPYRTCSAACSEKITVVNNGMGGGIGVYPGNSNWTASTPTQGTWETWIGRRGDVARAQLYADVRYEGGFHPLTSAAEPDLRLTDDTLLIANSNTGSNLPVAYHGILTEIVAWNAQDLPDAWERRHNDVVASHQGNRNPFVDHPEWADCLFAGNCGTGTPFCAGDGSLSTACPCGNSGGTGRGCANSQNPAGAFLKALGRTSPDMVVLTASGLLASVPCIFLQGSTEVVTGAPFGDGVRCVGGQLLRLSLEFASSGLASYPGPGEPTITARAAALGAPIAPGTTRWYQTYYRDADLAFCPLPSGNSWNVTSGVAITW